MKRFVPPESRSEWSQSWRSRWSGCGGPAVVIFGPPTHRTTGLLKRLRAVGPQVPPRVQRRIATTTPSTRIDELDDVGKSGRRLRARRRLSVALRLAWSMGIHDGCGDYDFNELSRLTSRPAG